MFTISHKDILDAAVFGTNIHREYTSYIPTKKNLQAGFAIEFENFGSMGVFLTALSANATYAYNDRHSMRRATTPDEARSLASDLQIDPLGTGIVAYFPGWELSDDV